MTQPDLVSKLREVIAKWRDDKRPDCTCPEGHFHQNNCPQYQWNMRRTNNQARKYADELESLLGLEGQAAEPRNLTDHQRAVEDAAGMPIDWSMANAAQVSSPSPSTPIVPGTAGLSAERVRSVLASHWLSGVHCHHAISPDDHTYDWASCACSEVNLPHRGTVGEAVGTWIEHVIVLLGAEPGVPLIHGRAELDIHDAKIRKDALLEAAQTIERWANGWKLRIESGMYNAEMRYDEWGDIPMTFGPAKHWDDAIAKFTESVSPSEKYPKAAGEVKGEKS